MSVLQRRQAWFGLIRFLQFKACASIGRDAGKSNEIPWFTGR